MFKVPLRKSNNVIRRNYSSKKQSLAIYTSTKPLIFMKSQQFYIRYRPYIWMFGMDGLFIGMPFSLAMTTAGVVLSTWAGVQAIQKTPSYALVKSIQFIDEENRSKLSLELINGQREIVSTSEVVMDHDPVFHTFLPFHSQWRSAMFQQGDLRSRNELKFTVLSQSFDVGQDKGNMAIAMGLFEAPTNLPIYVVRDSAKSIELTRSKLDYYRSVV